MQGWIEDPDELPTWLTIGRTVLVPRTVDLSLQEEYRPITCLNISYKIRFTGILAKYVKQHAVENDLWDKSQTEACEKVLGIADQLIIDNATMGEAKDNQRNVAVAYYDYRKAVTIWCIMIGCEECTNGWALQKK